MNDWPVLMRHNWVAYLRVYDPKQQQFLSKIRKELTNCTTGVLI